MPMKPLRILLCFLTLIIYQPLASHDAQAVTCTVDITDIDFNSINTLDSVAFSTTGTLTASCRYRTLDIIAGLLGTAICPGIGTGSGGASSANNRLLKHATGPETLEYQIYTDATHTILWPSFDPAFLFGSPPLLNFPPLVGTSTQALTLYLKIFAGQSLAKTGTYQSTFTGGLPAGTEIRQGALTALVGCSTLLSFASTNSNFTVRATVPKHCIFTTTAINFGSHSVLNTALNASGAINLTCTPETTYSIALETGSTPVNQRQMRNGANSVNYALYKDAGRTQLWGNSIADKYSGTGDGTQHVIPVYGSVPAQATPPPAVYTDNVIVTITY